MKQKIAILTDTNSGITPKQAKELGIYMVPMPVIIDGETYFENVSLTPEEFFRRLHDGADVSTSQPAIGKLMELWSGLLENYEEIIFQPMSSQLSSSFAIAHKLAEEFDGRVHVVDNRRISISLYQSVKEAKFLADHGKTAAEIVDHLQRESLEASIYIAVNTLEYLKKSGRVTAAGAAIGTALNIKPVLTIQGGKLDAYKKVRGMAAARNAMIEAIRSDLETRFAGRKTVIMAAYSGDEKAAEDWRRQIKKAFPKHKIEKAALPLSICCHIGDGALAIGALHDIF